MRHSLLLPLPPLPLLPPPLSRRHSEPVSVSVPASGVDRFWIAPSPRKKRGTGNSRGTFFLTRCHNSRKHWWSVLLDSRKQLRTTFFLTRCQNSKYRWDFNSLISNSETNNRSIVQLSKRGGCGSHGVLYLCACTLLCLYCPVKACVYVRTCSFIVG